MDKKTVLYTRVSTDQQRERESIETQIERLKSFAKREGLTAEVYKDDGYSAKDLNRPVLKKLLSEIEQGKIELIVITKLDRLTRQVKDLISLLELFEKHDVKIKSLDQRIDSTTAMGRAFTRIAAEFGQLEREMIAERVGESMRSRAEQGKWNGGVIPFGFTVENKVLCADPKEVSIIKKIFSMYLERKNIRSTTNELNKLGIKTRNGMWTTTTIKRILTNPIYIGTLTYNKRSTLPTTGKFIKQDQKNWILAKSVDPVIDSSIFNKTQSVLKEKRLSPLREATNYMLTGVLCCAKCGGHLLGTRNQKRGEKAYRYYKCCTGYHRGAAFLCRTAVNADKLETLVTDTLFALLENQTLMSEKEIEKRYKLNFLSEGKSQTDISSLERKNQEISRKIEKLLSFASEDDFASQSARSKINELGRQFKENEVLISGSTQKKEGSVSELQEFARIASNFKILWAKATTLQKKEIISRIFTKITFKDLSTPLVIEGRSVFLRKTTHGHGFMAHTIKKRQGNFKFILAREMCISPSSMGDLKLSIESRLNSGNSSKKRMP